MDGARYAGQRAGARVVADGRPDDVRAELDAGGSRDRHAAHGPEQPGRDTAAAIPGRPALAARQRSHRHSQPRHRRRGGRTPLRDILLRGDRVPREPADVVVRRERPVHRDELRRALRDLDGGWHLVPRARRECACRAVHLGAAGSGRRRPRGAALEHLRPAVRRGTVAEERPAGAPRFRAHSSAGRSPRLGTRRRSRPSRPAASSRPARAGRP